MAPPQPTSTIRKKIEIRRIDSEEARQVCFSKRHAGLFNKAIELATLCGVEVAAVTFSPGGKAYTFGHPSVEFVLDRFLSSNSPEELVAVAADGGAGDQNKELAELNRKYGEMRAQLAAIKARKEAVDESLAKARTEAWLDPDTEVSQMGEEDLVAFAAALAKVRVDVAAYADQVPQDALLFGRPVHGGGGSEFEIGGTSASSEMEMTLLEMPPPPPPTGFAAGAELTQQQQMMMEVPPPQTGFAAGMETMQHQQQQMMMMAMAPTRGFAAGTEMMQQQQMMATSPTLPPVTGFDAGAEMMQKQQMIMAMPPPPPLPGFGTGMETVHQGFGPHGFPQ